MFPDIEFVYKGVTYTVSFKAYNLGQIEIGDDLLRVEKWNEEVFPPVPTEMVCIDHKKGRGHFKDTVLAEIKKTDPVKEPMYILVSNGDGACVLKVERVPDVGKNICIEESMVHWKSGFDAYFVADHIYKVAEYLTIVAMPKFGDLPWFRLEKIEIK